MLFKKERKNIYKVKILGDEQYSIKEASPSPKRVSLARRKTASEGEVQLLVLVSLFYNISAFVSSSKSRSCRKTVEVLRNI